MVKRNKPTLIKVVLGILVLGVIAISLFLGLSDINKRDATRLKGYEDAAAAVGVARAKQECRKEGLEVKVCDSITGAVSTTECGGMTCWIVYARSDDPHGYGASITINRHNGDGDYVVIDYLRDTGTHR